MTEMPYTPTPEEQDALRRIRDRLGPKGWIDDPEALAPWLIDSRNVYEGRCLGMAKPATTQEVSDILAIAYEAGIQIVPQGGNTSRVGGATPDPSGRQLLINLGRMNAVRDIDPANYTMTVEAGCILKDLQDKAESADRLFPLSLGAEGSCQIGGNLASNAGGINVLRYGNARDLVLGLEAVLPDGRIWNGLRRLRKDNTGYDLKQLFLGSEGTLCIITAAVLKLFPLPKERAAALVALSDLDAAVTLLEQARTASADALMSFELMPGFALDWAERHVEGAKQPFDTTYDWTVLLEIGGTRADGSAGQALEGLLERAYEDGHIVDAVLPQSEEQRSQIWFLREAIVDAQVREGAQVKHDVSVPVSRVPDFIRQANAAVIEMIPGIRPYPFGHVGDGNIHYNLSQPVDMAAADFATHREALQRRVHDVALSLDGSISAEHGIGLSKREEMLRCKSDVELETMRALKNLFDPKGLMNPGKTIPAARAETK
ncbi:FAD-binding oxidoreductase [Pacificispira sp.]|uniref:FAD-binding oxidoreductase n=1 Tax=Pacificispira sp. TaxID=2888761 RepID=UPI003B51CBD9